MKRRIFAVIMALIMAIAVSVYAQSSVAEIEAEFLLDDIESLDNIEVSSNSTEFSEDWLLDYTLNIISERTHRYTAEEIAEILSIDIFDAPTVSDITQHEIDGVMQTSVFYRHVVTILADDRNLVAPSTHYVSTQIGNAIFAGTLSLISATVREDPWFGPGWYVYAWVYEGLLWDTGFRPWGEYNKAD